MGITVCSFDSSSHIFRLAVSSWSVCARDRVRVSGADRVGVTVAGWDPTCGEIPGAFPTSMRGSLSWFSGWAPMRTRPDIFVWANFSRSVRRASLNSPIGTHWVRCKSVGALFRAAFSLHLASASLTSERAVCCGSYSWTLLPLLVIYKRKAHTALLYRHTGTTERGGRRPDLTCDLTSTSCVPHGTRVTSQPAAIKHPAPPGALRHLSRVSGRNAWREDADPTVCSYLPADEQRV